MTPRCPVQSKTMLEDVACTGEGFFPEGCGARLTLFSGDLYNVYLEDLIDPSYPHYPVTKLYGVAFSCPHCEAQTLIRDCPVKPRGINPAREE